MTPLSGFHVTRRVYGFDAPISDVAPLERLGGKGLALRRLVQLGCDVPPGLTITTDAVAELIAAPDAWPKLYAELEPELQRLADRTQSAWGCGPKPLTLAIRSGAVQSQPGLMRTLLHCGWTTALAEASATLDGWREFAAFLAGLLPASPQSNALRGEAEATNAATSPATLHDLCQTRMQALKDSGLAVEDRPDAWLRLAIEHVAASAREATPPLRTAITVQAMFTAEMSGVLRSRDPLHPDADEMVVEAVAGDGLALMSGGSTPMIWRMPRDPDRIGGAVGDEAIPLSSSAQQRLHQAALRIEHAAGQTVEMEWGVAGDRLVLFQFRPAQDALQYIPSLDREIHNIRELAWEGRRLWVRHQLAEALPLPTPLTWSVWDQFASPQGGLGELYRRLGYAPRVFADGGGCLALLAGRIYADPDRWAQLIASSFPLRHDADQLAARPELFLEAPTTIDPQRLDPWLLLKWPHLLWVVLRAARRQAALARTAAAEFTTTVVPEFHAELDAQRRLQGAVCDLSERLARTERLRHWLFQTAAPRLLLPGWLGVQAWGVMRRILKQRLPPDQVERETRRWLSELERSPPPSSADSPGDRADVASLVDLESIQLELSEPAGVDHGALDPLAARDWTDPIEPEANDRARLVSDWCRTTGRSNASFERARRTAIQLLPLRNVGKQLFLAGYQLLRESLAEMTRTTGLADRLYYLSWVELLRLQQHPVATEVLDQRRLAREFWKRTPVPCVIRGDHSRPLAVSPPDGRRGPWVVQVISPGRAHGPVWQPSTAPGDCPEGAIVVAESVDSPAVIRWRAAAGFIVERGGLLSHAAVTARRLGLPMVLLPDATRRLTTAELVWLDADAAPGSVHIGTDAGPDRAPSAVHN